MSLNRRVGLVHEIQDLPSEEDLVELLCSMLDTHSYTQVTSIGSFLKVKFPLLSWSKYSVSGLTSFLEKYSKYFETRKIFKTPSIFHIEVRLRKNQNSCEHYLKKLPSTNSLLLSPSLSS